MAYRTVSDVAGIRGLRFRTIHSIIIHYLDLTLQRSVYHVLLPAKTPHFHRPRELPWCWVEDFLLCLHSSRITPIRPLVWLWPVRPEWSLELAGEIATSSHLLV
jgi:hypothetical protein